MTVQEGKNKVVVTGASGLLGRAVCEEFKSKGMDVVALAHTRAKKDKAYTALDLTDVAAVDEFFANNRVDAVIHCAAERRPDVAEASINVAVPEHLGRLAAEHKFTLIYISTDYVFNGRQPPYEVDARPDPLQMYGKQKLAGEHAIVTAREKGANATCLRVPVLYGKVEYNAESAVNVLVDVVQDRSGKQYSMDDYQIRNPTNVADVARVLHDLAQLPSLPPATHFRSTGPSMTKWEMTRIIASALNLPTDHITPQSEKPVIKPGQTERPWNTELSVQSLVDLGINTDEAQTFEAWWRAYLQK